MLLSLARSYVTAMNTGSCPTIMTAWQAVVETENSRILRQCASAFKRVCSRFRGSKVPLMEEGDFMGALEEAKQHALQDMLQQGLGEEKSSFAQRLQKELDEKIEAVRQSQDRKSEKVVGCFPVLCPPRFHCVQKVDDTILLPTSGLPVTYEKEVVVFFFFWCCPRWRPPFENPSSSPFKRSSTRGSFLDSTPFPDRFRSSWTRFVILLSHVFCVPVQFCAKKELLTNWESLCRHSHRARLWPKVVISFP